MFEAFGARMEERALIYLTTTTAPVHPGIMVGLAKVRHPLITLTLCPLLYPGRNIKGGSSAVPLILFVQYLCGCPQSLFNYHG